MGSTLVQDFVSIIDNTMNKEQLERLLNTACELLVELEHSANEEQKVNIEALFQEIQWSDRLDEDMARLADLEAQDWETFGNDKI